MPATPADILADLVAATTGLTAIAADVEGAYHDTIEYLTCDLWLNDKGIYLRAPGPEPRRFRACGVCEEDDNCPDDYEPDWDVIYGESTTEPEPHVETEYDAWYANNYAEIQLERYLDFHDRNDVAEMEALEAQQRADAEFALNGYGPDYGLWLSENVAERDGTLLSCHRRTCATCGDWATHIHPREPDGRRCARCRGSGYDPDEDVRDGDAPEDCCHRCIGSGMEIRYTICTVIDAPTVRAQPGDDPFQVPAQGPRG